MRRRNDEETETKSERHPPRVYGAARVQEDLHVIRKRRLKFVHKRVHKTNKYLGEVPPE
jgi:hypothetical protein